MATRALVLGGGGPVGIAWESGLVAGLAEHGVLVGEADLIVGTSAGSVVGAELALGRAPAELVASQRGRSDSGVRPASGTQPAPPDLTPLMELMQRAWSGDADPEALRREIGAFALRAQTASEDQFIAGFGHLKDVGPGQWPERRFVCTAVDTATGEFMTWDRDAGVALGRAVASSCSVPGIFPPITINGRRYMDGGMRSATNADLAKGYERVVLVAVTAGEGDDPRAQMARRRLEGEITALTSSGSRVELITPDEGARRAFGLNLMDGTRRGPAADEGVRQGREEAARLKAFWQG